MIGEFSLLVGTAYTIIQGLKAIQEIPDRKRRKTYGRKIKQIQLKLDDIIAHADPILDRMEILRKTVVENISIEQLSNLINLLGAQVGRIGTFTTIFRDQEMEDLIRLFNPELRRAIRPRMSRKEISINEDIYIIKMVIENRHDDGDVSIRVPNDNIKRMLTRFSEDRIANSRKRIDELKTASTEMRQLIWEKFEVQDL